MLRDVELFRSRISKLDGAGDVGDYVFGIVEGKDLADKALQPANPHAKGETEPPKPSPSPQPPSDEQA